MGTTYGVPEEKIDLIPHGIPDTPFADSESYNLQFGVEARLAIIASHPRVIYLVLGATHPHLLASDGEIYRLGLERLAEQRGVRDHVIFYNRFVTIEELKEEEPLYPSGIPRRSPLP